MDISPLILFMAKHTAGEKDLRIKAQALQKSYERTVEKRNDD